MALVTTKEMFAKAYEGGYAIGAFNVNNMEIVQAITEACREEKAPVILQVFASHNNESLLPGHRCCNLFFQDGIYIQGDYQCLPD